MTAPTVEEHSTEQAKPARKKVTRYFEVGLLARVDKVCGNEHGARSQLHEDALALYLDRHAGSDPATALVDPAPLDESTKATTVYIRADLVSQFHVFVAQRPGSLRLHHQRALRDYLDYLATSS